MTTIRFPSQKRYASEEGYLNGVYRYMTRIGLQHFYRLFRSTGQVEFSLEEVRRWLDEAVTHRVSVLDYQERASKGELDGEKWNRFLDNASAFIVQEFDPINFYLTAAARGARSRKKSKAVLLLGMDGMSIAEQAKALGLQPRQVSNLRAQLKRQQQMNRSPQPSPLEYLLDEFQPDLVEA